VKRPGPQGTLPSQFRLDLSVAPGNAREFELWRSGMQPLFALDAGDAEARSSFAAGLTSYQFADVAIIAGGASATIFQRTPSIVARSGLDNICLLVYTQGGCALDVEGNAVGVHPGDVCFFDLLQPGTLRAPDYQSLTLILPRAALRPFVADIDGLHGRILRRSSPLNVILVRHLQTLFAEAPTLSAADGRAAANGTAALIAAFAGTSDQGREMIARSAPAASLLRFRQFIEAKLPDPDLGPESICRQLGVSRTTLFRVFESLGGVRRYILQRRLARAHRLIADPGQGQRRIGTIAFQCGFNSVSVFSRAFHQAFGLSPTELRGAADRDDRSDAALNVALSGEGGFGTMSRWLLGLDAG